MSLWSRIPGVGSRVLRYCCTPGTRNGVVELGYVVWQSPCQPDSIYIISPWSHGQPFGAFTKSRAQTSLYSKAAPESEMPPVVVQIALYGKAGNGRCVWLSFDRSRRTCAQMLTFKTSQHRGRECSANAKGFGESSKWHGPRRTQPTVFALLKGVAWRAQKKALATVTSTSACASHYHRCRCQCWDW